MGAINNLLIGGLDLDTSINIMGKNKFVDALNITLDAVEGSQDMAATNLVGNRLVPYTLPSGICQVIGATGDLLRDVVYYFVWNANLRHSVLKYDNATRTITKLIENLTDTGTVNILKFDRYKKVIHIDVIHRDEGDLVYWVDSINRPRKINVSTIQTYVPVTEDIINAAKNAPSFRLAGIYFDDANVNVNNLRKKLFQFAQSWVYKDLEESTLSPLSKVPLPVNGYDNDVMNDPTKNNNIQLPLTGGPADYQKIKLYGRELIGTTWSDYFLIDTFDKDDYNIPPGGGFIYYFYNDGVYPVQDVIRTTNLFDWLPDIANAQALANGNALVYGGITEGYNNLTRAQVDVRMTSAIGAATVPTISYVLAGSDAINVFIGATIVVGTTYHIQFEYDNPAPGTPFLLNYVTPLGATQASVATAIAALITGGGLSAVTGGSGTIHIANSNGGFNDVSMSVSTAGAENAAAAWDWYSKYRFALIYFNDLMKPLTIISYVGASIDDNDFAVTTPDFATSSGVIQVPYINASINHLPPAGAKTYQWLRTPNLTTDKFLYWITNDYQTDTDYLYFCIENLTYTGTQNTGFVPSYEFAKGDHLRAMAKYSAGAFTTYNVQLDFEIIGIVERTMTSPASTGRFVKVAKPTTLPSVPYSANIFIELYTPSLRTSETAQVFYEWGERQLIYEYTPGVFYHVGQIRNQTPTEPATFQWFDGDVYAKDRTSYLDVGATTTITEFTMDANYNDYFVSSVNSNGRAWPLNQDAKVQYFPALIRFGQEYQPDTNLNGLNTFYPDDFYDRCNRSYGDILKLSVKGSYLRVGQKYKIGSIPVNLQIIKDSNGQDVLATSDQLLNQVVYYIGDYGVGDTPEAWVEYNNSTYGVYSTRGIIWRLAADGIIPISVLYKVNSWATDHIPKRNGNEKIYGGYDSKSNNYIIALEATVDDPAYTLTFDEKENQFQSFVSAHPEMICTLGALLIMFKDGGLYTHDSNIYNRFFGADYESSITIPFNEGIREKKSFTVISEISNTIWDMPIAWTNTNTYGTQRQETNLVEAEFQVLEGAPSSAIKCDIHSPGGKINGQKLKGSYIVVKLRKQNASSLVYLAEATVNFIQSPLTSK